MPRPRTHDYQTVNSDITLNPGQSGQASATCPGGSAVYGVGEQSGLRAGIQLLTADGPDLTAPDEAEVRVMNLDTNNAQFGAQAICANGAPLGVLTEGSDVDLPSNGYIKASAEVPNTGDEVVTGGGGVPDPAQSAYLTDSYPDTAADGNAAWSVWVRNSSNTDEQAIATAAGVG